jgi:hypothetical protein
VVLVRQSRFDEDQFEVAVDLASLLTACTERRFGAVAHDRRTTLQRPSANHHAARPARRHRPTRSGDLIELAQVLADRRAATRWWS